MKNLNISTHSLKYSTRFNLLTYTFTLLLLMCASVTMKSQNIKKDSANTSHKGIRAAFFGSPSGCGGLLSAQFYVERENFQVYAGPVFQRGLKHLSGAMIGTEYTLTGNGHRLYAEADYGYATNVQLFLFARGIFQQSAMLSRSNAKIEERTAAKEGIALVTVKVKTIEMYAGFGVRVNLFRNLKWINSIGMGGYTTLNPNYRLYRDKNNIGILVSTGISASF